MIPAKQGGSDIGENIPDTGSSSKCQRLEGVNQGYHSFFFFVVVFLIASFYKKNFLFCILVFVSVSLNGL